MLTGEYVFETYGHEAHVRATWPERAAELALRSDASLEDVVLMQTVLAGPDNEPQASARPAIRAGDAAGAAAAWTDCERLLRAAHDLRREAISDILSWIHAEHGADALRNAQLYAAARGPWGASFPAERDASPEDRLRSLTLLLGVGPYARMSITEENDRWVVQLLPCGTCGRQIRDRYRDDTGWRLGTATEASLTLGTPAFSAYQTHLAVIHHGFGIEVLGAPWPGIRCGG
jgi:hypothetical protein